MPTLNHLKCFVSVAETHSITAAAKRLHRSPSAISMTLSNLEAEFGRALFESDGKSRLTPFGSYVFEIASEQINRFTRAIDSVQAYANNSFGKVNIATLPSFASQYLPTLLSSFNKNYPQITLAIRDDNSVRINHLVIQGEIDVGIASPIKEDAENVLYQPIITDPIGVICSPNHALARLKRPLIWEDLQGLTFIANGTCNRIEDPEFQEIVAAAEIDVQNTTSILAMVSANIGVTTLPRLAVPEARQDVVFLPTAYENLHRSICILTPADRSLSPATEAFIETVMEIKEVTANVE
jgi:LysR family carnitine catabolism transcriptional activator